MALTGNQLLQGFSRFISDWWSSSTTSAGAAGGTTLIDTLLRRFGEDYARDMYLRPTQSGTNQYAIRRVSTFTTSTGSCTVAPGFAAQVAGGDTYELHRYDPDEKFSALDEARFRAYPDLAEIVYDETLTGDGIRTEFDIPSTIRGGPMYVFTEVPLTPEPRWNFLTNPRNDSTTGWTAASTTAATVTLNDYDLVVPKYDSTCTSLTTAATTAASYSQVVGDMTNSITASLAADRLMTFAAWVYCTEASKVRLRILDDSGTLATSAAYHGGGGWELLTLEGTVAGNNATTLTARILIDSTANASTIYVNRCWFYFGESNLVRDVYPESTGKLLRRDDTTQRLHLDFAPQRGHQIRLVGRDHLTALGSTAATQATNSMEVDNASASILYAYAAEILFERMGLLSEMPSEVQARIQTVRARIAELRPSWKIRLPGGGQMKSPWK